MPSCPGSRPTSRGWRRTTASRLAADFIDALAALHRVAWQDRPIAALAGGITAENAARVNVEYWETQIGRWAMRSYPLAEWGIRWLKAHCPVAPRVAIVHGDYRTGNFLEVGGRIYLDPRLGVGAPG